MMDSMSMVIGLMCQQFVYFVYGQRLQSKSASLYRCLYFNNWYNAPSKYISGISIVFERTRKPFILMAGSLIPINLSSFVTINLHATTYVYKSMYITLCICEEVKTDTCKITMNNDHLSAQQDNTD
ncbi:odorant receptor 23a-like [Lycorma delicatula]|uniref:odorant receptor 23a-like n=1 Tax=Lycorma delicatula TaxID=130591 RepID=UPI003F514405